MMFSFKSYGLFIFVFLLLIGCVQKVWYQEGKTYEDCRKDLLKAKLEAIKHGYIQPSPFGDPISSGINAGFEQALREQAIINAYMEAEGYRLVPLQK